MNETTLIDIYGALDEILEEIGNSASVGIELLRQDGRMPSLVFRVDWPAENWHYRHEFTATRLLAHPQDIIEIVIYQAQKSFAERWDAIRRMTTGDASVSPPRRDGNWK